MMDGLTVPGDDDIPLVHARLGSWSFRLDLHHHDTSCATFDHDKLEAKSEITPRDVPVLLKSRCDTLNGSRRDHKDASARPEHCHADYPTDRVNGKPAFRTLPHAQIKLDPSLDLTTSEGRPWAGTAGHHAKCSGWRTSFRAHCYSNGADRYGLCLKTNRWQLGAINAQERDVGGVITSNEPRRDGFAT